MNLALVYDTETTGLPDWHQPSDAPQQPHLVAAGEKLTGKQFAKLNEIYEEHIGGQ